MDTNELQHHGIKGQKWGVRRYQNKDGTLTSRGKKRYKTDYSAEAKKMSDDELRARINRLTNEKKYMDLTAKESKFSRSMDKLQRNADRTSKTSKVKANVAKIRNNKEAATRHNIAVKGFDAVSKSASIANKTSKLVREPKHVKRAKKILDGMSDEDLRKTVARLDLEKQYSQISRESSRRGKITTDKVLDIFGDVVTVAASVTGIIVGIKTIQKLDETGLILR